MYSENVRQIQKNDDDLYARILSKLSSASVDEAAHIPLLCVCTFNLSERKWLKLIERLSALGINVRLIEIVKGVPINALFYLSNLDLIYVRTAEELEGYVPKDCCKPISCGALSVTNSSCSNNANLTTNCNSNTNMAKSANYIESLSEFNFKPIQDVAPIMDTYRQPEHDSIKYHSLSSSEYDDLIEAAAASSATPASCCSNNNGQKGEENNRGPQFGKMRDSGYKSELEAQPLNNKFSDENDYFCLNVNCAAKPTSQSLLKMQSRSRLPISVGSNLNLTLMDHQTDCSLFTASKSSHFCFPNSTYKAQSPSSLLHVSSRTANNNKNNNNSGGGRRHTPDFSNKKYEFERAKNSRRSLDSSLAQHSNRFFAVPIDLNLNDQQEQQHFHHQALPQNEFKLFSDLDLKRIELDSLLNDDTQQQHQTLNSEEGGNKLWTVILRHEARNFQEISVLPGMLVSIIKTFNELIYVRLVGFENSGLGLSQQYGILPKNCVADLNEVLILNRNSADAQFRTEVSKSQRKPQQITAL